MAFNDPTEPWWQHAVCYQVYVRSFADSNGDGIGDLPGITSRLGYLHDLGVDALWITPFYTSPQHDHGYDVADYFDVDRLFGTLADADDLIGRAHALGLRVIVDVVPNHTSSEHEWFRAALAAEPGSRERDRYLFRDGRGADGGEPPNNWRSVFGGPAWTRVPDGQWYLHVFDPTQPDLNWRNPEVPDMFDDVLRFWLDRGVDGFRIDVAHGLFKEESLRDQVLAEHEQPRSGSSVSDDGGMVHSHADDEPMWDQPEVHDAYRRWHKVLAEYDGDRMTVAEAWTNSPESMARYVRSDELSQSFNFHWLVSPWSATAFARCITDTFSALAPVGATPTWVLSNHDVVRHVTRYGGGERGLARAQASTLAMLGLPGSAYLYQGEELGLPQVEVPPGFRQDPAWFRTGEEGRDGCRVPLPWSGEEPPYGFGPGVGQPWIPQPPHWHGLAVDAQDGDPESTLEFYRRTLRARKDLTGRAGDLVEVIPPAAHGLGEDVLVFTRGEVTVLLNCGPTGVPLPAGRVLVSSGPVCGELPPDTAVWLSRQ